jgi:hypothetical protein
MTRRQKLGILLLAAAPCTGIALWPLRFQAFQVGPTVTVARGSTASYSWEETVTVLTFNWAVILPIVLLAVLLGAAGLACLFLPSRREHH